MKILYYDCSAGISGDMNLGALISLGVDKDYLKTELDKLPVKDEFRLVIQTAARQGIAGVKADVIETGIHDHHHGRHLSDIEGIILGSSLSKAVKDNALKIFNRVAFAEAVVHGKPVSEVHFHEVGAIDSIVDIVGAAICFDALDVDVVIASPVELGGGYVRCDHGLIPVPAPATVEILKGVPITCGATPHETTTPTGAAILAANVEEFKSKISFTIKKTGYGIGEREHDIPNVLRVMLAETDDTDHESEEGHG